MFYIKKKPVILFWAISFFFCMINIFSQSDANNEAQEYVGLSASLLADKSSISYRKLNLLIINADRFKQGLRKRHLDTNQEDWLFARALADLLSLQGGRAVSVENMNVLKDMNKKYPDNFATNLFLGLALLPENQKDAQAFIDKSMDNNLEKTLTACYSYLSLYSYSDSDIKKDRRYLLTDAIFNKIKTMKGWGKNGSLPKLLAKIMLSTSSYRSKLHKKEYSDLHQQLKNLFKERGLPVPVIISETKNGGTTSHIEYLTPAQKDQGSTKKN